MIVDLDVNYRLHPESLPYGKYMSESDRHQGAQPIDVHALLHRMQQFGIDMTGVVANVSARDLGRGGQGEVLNDNTADLIHSAIRDYPDKLFGWVGIDPLGGMGTIRYIQYAVRDLGFRGVHVFPHWFVLEINDRAYYPIYAKCAELGVPLAMQCGIGASMSANNIVAGVDEVKDVLFDFPELTLMALRAGQPWERGFVALARLFPNLVLVGDNPPAHWAKDFIDVLNLPAGDGAAGDLTARVVWGTNGRVPPTEDLNAIQGMKIDETVRARFLGGNAARLLGLGGHA